MPLKKIFLFAAIFFSSILSARPGHGQEKFPESWEIDATLRSVFFLDHDLGWAVGDKGTLLKTEDGGREWQSISSPRDIIWTSVFFADDSNGWIAGGHYRGPLERSVGLLIKTEDGGKTWSNLSPPGVSLIRRIRFADPSHGWIACDSNQLYPDGLLKTEDGGAAWTSARASGEPPLLLDWDEEGQLHTLSIDRQVSTPTGFAEKGPSCPVLDPQVMLCLQNGRTIVAGTRELAVRSKGTDWTQSTPVSLHDTSNWICGFAWNQHAWLAGAPGNLMLRSEDGGNTWHESRTGQNFSIVSIFFLDENRGWAVGELGKIITTKDGGLTWTCQRNEKRQTAVLNLATDESKISLDAIALLGGSFGHLCGISVIGEKPPSGIQPLRMSQATGRAGGSVYWRSGTTSARFLKQLVQEIRSRRPHVILIHHRDSLMKQWIVRAVENARNPGRFPELAEKGITPWKVQKVVSITGDDPCDNSFSIQQFSAQLGRTVSLQARFAGLLVDESHLRTGKADRLKWNTLFSSLPTTVAGKGMTNGTLAQSTPECNRSGQEIQIDNMQQFRSVSNWNSAIQQLGRLSILSPIDEKTWLEHVTASTSGLDQICYAFFLRDLADHYSSLGKPIMADHSERLILQKVSGTEIGEASLWKMIQRYGSLESNFHLNSLVANRFADQHHPATIDPKVHQPIGPRIPPPGGSLRQSALTSRNIDVTSASYANATQLMEIFQNRFPEAGSRPAVEFLIATLKSRTGNRSSLDRLLDQATGTGNPGKTQSRILRERELLKVEAVIPGSISLWDVTGQRIHLDGRLDEEVWKKETSTKTPGEKLRFAVDEDFLYFAYTREFPQVFRAEPSRRRIRDESLTLFDRIRLLIDFDRDYHSAIELTVDVRGACNDAIWRDSQTRDASFNPTWYVASKHENGRWTVEAAIPRRELPQSSGSGDIGWLIQTDYLTAGRKEPVLSRRGSLFRHERLLLFSRLPLPAISGVSSQAGVPVKGGLQSTELPGVKIGSAQNPGTAN